MVIDEGLLRQAREFGVRLTGAQRQADLAKADYHHAVRRMHFAGASMREIADALDVSHQRVHQIIEAAGGTGGWKVRKTSGELACTFCGLSKDQVAKLIAGPGVYICDGCVGLANRVDDQPVETSRTRLDPVPRVSELQCSFCGKESQQVARMVAGPGVRICADCIDLCNEVLAAAASESEQ